MSHSLFSTQTLVSGLSLRFLLKALLLCLHDLLVYLTIFYSTALSKKKKNCLLILTFWSQMQKAVEEEQYKDAIFMRDYAGTGLVSLVAGFWIYGILYLQLLPLNIFLWVWSYAAVLFATKKLFLVCFFNALCALRLWVIHSYKLPSQPDRIRTSLYTSIFFNKQSLQSLWLFAPWAIPPWVLSLLANFLESMSLIHICCTSL